MFTLLKGDRYLTSLNLRLIFISTGAPGSHSITKRTAKSSQTCDDGHRLGQCKIIYQHYYLNLLPTSKEGNIFRSVYQSFCSRGEGGGDSVQREGALSGGGCPEGGLCPVWVSVQTAVSVQEGGGRPLVLTSGLLHCSSWYASYWNAFL